MQKFITKFIDIDPVTLSLIGALLVIMGTLFFIAWVLESKNKKLRKRTPVDREKITRVGVFKDLDNPDDHGFVANNIDKYYRDKDLFV